MERDADAVALSAGCAGESRPQSYLRYYELCAGGRRGWLSLAVAVSAMTEPAELRWCPTEQSVTRWTVTRQEEVRGVELSINRLAVCKICRGEDRRRIRVETE